MFFFLSVKKDKILLLFNKQKKVFKKKQVGWD